MVRDRVLPAQVITPVFADASVEDSTVTMEAWCDIISAFSADAQLAAKPRVRATVLNPIQYTVGNHSIDKARVKPTHSDALHGF